jgi:hypothetical protein
MSVLLPTIHFSLTRIPIRGFLIRDDTIHSKVAHETFANLFAIERSSSIASADIDCGNIGRFSEQF